MVTGEKRRAGAAEYEKTGLEPEEIKELAKTIIALGKMLANNWIPVEKRLPETDDYILLSFANFTLPAVGRYEINDSGSGAFYLGDCDEEDTCINQDLFVNAWQPLPEPYRPERSEE